MATSLLLAPMEPAHATKVFFVNSTEDQSDTDLSDGRCDVEPPSVPVSRCTLRAAIEEANVTPGADSIAFNLPGGQTRIFPGSDLPAITEQLSIDGYTQPGASPNTLAQGNNAVLKVELNGQNADFYGLDVRASNTIIQGLAIHGFDGAGIIINAPALGARVEGNFIGTGPSGVQDLGNGGSGVDIRGGGAYVVGASSPASRNVISGNDRSGVSISDLTNNRVQGNYIGTDKDGTGDLGNEFEGVSISGASNLNTIGGARPERATLSPATTATASTFPASGRATRSLATS